MEQTSDDFPQWKKLESQANKDQEKPGYYCNKLLTSLDHAIFLHGFQVYTFHLKECFWSKFDIKRLTDNPHAMKCMSSNSCLARPGLIVDLYFESSRYTSSSLLLSLTFETEGGSPRDFCQQQHSLNHFGLAKLSDFTISADETSIYLFGGKFESTYSDTFYKMDIESRSVIELKNGSPRPNGRTGHANTISNNKFFVFGGRDDQSIKLSDLWALDLGKMKWEHIDANLKSRLKPISESSPQIFAYNNQILLCDYSREAEGNSFLIFSYDLDNNSWGAIGKELFIPSIQKGPFFGACQDLFIVFDGSDFHTLEMPRKTGKKKKTQLDNFMAQLFKDKDQADITFKVEEEEIQANKCILSARSSYFKNMFSSKMLESHSQVIPVHNVQAKVFKAMLQHIYFIEMKFDKDIARDLYELAHEYRLQDLVDECEEILEGEICVGNVIENIQWAKKFEAKSFREACLAFIARNSDEVFKTQNVVELGNETVYEIFKLKK